MTEQYIKKLVDYFYDLRYEDIPEKVLHQVQRVMLDYVSCNAYASTHDICSPLVKVIRGMSGEGSSSIWGQPGGVNPSTAACCNAARISNIELDDVSDIGASTHAGVYVWSSAYAAFQESPCDAKTFTKAIIFGYELALRMGFLSTQKVRDLGLHGPGLNGAFASVATAGMIYGLSKEEMISAIGFAGALLPICPYVSFLEGSDVKDMYGGWGCYLGLLAAKSAKEGLTGADNILDGPKSLKGVYCGDEGDFKIGEDFLINFIAFKEFASNASVHPCMSALLNMMDKHPFTVDEVEHVRVDVYPYGYQLNQGVHEPLNPTNSRMSLPYTVSICIQTHGLRPDAFFPEALVNEQNRILMPKVDVYNHPEYGDNAFSLRGTIVTVTLKNGEVLTEESIGSRWGRAVPDSELLRKFHELTDDIFTKEQSERIQETIWSYGEGSSIQPIIDIMKTL